MSQEIGLVTLSHLSLVVTLTSDWTTNGCMGSPATYTFPSSILLSLHSWFTNALFEWPRRHWNSPTSPSLNYPRSLSLPFSRVLRAYIGTPIHPTPYLCLLFYRQSHTLLDLDSCTYSAFCFDSASCPEHFVLPLLIPSDLQFSLMGEAEPRMGSPQRMEAVE